MSAVAFSLPAESAAARGWVRLRRDPAAMACLLFLVVLVLSAVFLAPFTGYTFEETSHAQYAPPSEQHWMGTDIHGRDLLTRLLYGARVSLLVGLIGATVSLFIGVTYGAVAGYVGGAVDSLMMRILEIIYSLPRLVFVMVMLAALEGPVTTQVEALGQFLGIAPDRLPDVRLLLLFICLGAVEWLSMARIVRGQVLVLKEQQFVQASLALGQSHWRIIVRHMLPNLAGIILVYLTLTIPVVMLEEAFLSFLGLGVRAPLASWGSLISEAAQLINPFQIYWWLLLFPAGAMALTLLALNFLGDTLRDLADPRGAK